MRFVAAPVHLRPHDTDAIRAHLLKLPLTDRYLRFCSALSDSAINAYVDRLDLAVGGKDVGFGVYDSKDQLAGMIHIAPMADHDSAEFALSVDEDVRHRGIGDQLFGRGIQHCEALGIKRVYMNCLSTNAAIKKMAQRRQMSITTDYGESIAQLDLKDVNKAVAWLHEVQTDALALYDLRCLPMRQAWDDYIRLVKEHTQKERLRRMMTSAKKGAE